MQKSLGLLIVLTTLLSQTSACTPIRKENDSAVVRQKDNAPCFSIANNPKTRSGEAHLEMLQVIDEQGKDVWRVDFTQQPQLLADQCVPYGLSNRQNNVKTPAINLLPNKLYRVAIFAPMPKYPQETKVYTANFCLLKQADQHIIVHQIQMDVTTSRWQIEVCKLR